MWSGPCARAATCWRSARESQLCRRGSGRDPRRGRLRLLDGVELQQPPARGGGARRRQRGAAHPAARELRRSAARRVDLKRREPIGGGRRRGSQQKSEAGGSPKEVDPEEVLGPEEARVSNYHRPLARRVPSAGARKWSELPRPRALSRRARPRNKPRPSEGANRRGTYFRVDRPRTPWLRSAGCASPRPRALPG